MNGVNGFYEDHGATHSTIDADFVGHSNSNLEKQSICNTSSI